MRNGIGKVLSNTSDANAPIRVDGRSALQYFAMAYESSPALGGEPSMRIEQRDSDLTLENAW